MSEYRKILAVDLSSPVASLALFSNTTSVATQELAGRNTHSELFLSTVEELLSKAGWFFSDIEALVTSRGPGSFTGLRIAFASLLGFAQVKNWPLITINGSEARFRAYLREGGAMSADFRVLTKIATGRFVEARFDSQGQLLSEKEKTQLEELNSHTVIITDGLVALPSVSQPVVVRALRAADLGAIACDAVSRREFVAASHFAGFSPEYFGSSQFD